MEKVFDSSVIVAIISALGAVGVTILTARLQQKRIAKHKPPKDRVDTIFDGYEKLIAQQSAELTRKEEVVTHLQTIVEKLESELGQTKALLFEAKQELRESKRQNNLLQQQLVDMKRQYGQEGL